MPEKSHRLILKLPFIYKAWGYWILIHSNVLVWTVKQFFILTAFPWEKSVFFHGSTPLFQPQKGQGQGNQGNMCWLSISLYFKLVILIFFFWFIEIALYLNHIIQVGRILISTLTFVSVYKSHLYLPILCPLFSKFSTQHNLLDQQFYSKPKEIPKLLRRTNETDYFSTKKDINFSI